MSSLMKLIAEHPELQREFADLVDEIRGPVPLAGHPGLDEAEVQQVLPETWQSAADVPEMLMPDQAEFALAKISQLRSQMIADQRSSLEQFERDYAEELQRLYKDEAEKKQEVSQARAALLEAESRLKEEVSRAREKLRVSESNLAMFRSGGVARRTTLHSENRRIKSSVEVLHAELARAILSARKKYEKELAIVQAMHRAVSDKVKWDRMRLESELRKSNAKQTVGAGRQDAGSVDEHDEGGGGYDDSPVQSQPPSRGLSFAALEEHPMVSDSNEAPAEDKPAAERSDRVPWEEVAAECQVQVSNYADWMSNYASGWGNNKRLDFARKRILARRVGAEVPDWPAEIAPGKYLGRSPLPADLVQLYSEVPEDRIMRSARVVPLIDDKEKAGEEIDETPAADDPGIP